MSPKASTLCKRILFVTALASFFALLPSAAVAQVGAAARIAVIDSDRIVTESTRGRAALETLRTRQDEKLAEGRQIQQEINDLRRRIDEGQMSLAPERLAELRKQYEDRMIAFRRFQDDADRELSTLRDDALSGIERDVLTIIQQIGEEGGYTLIFNKFQSGLVFADDTVDITDQVIQRFNTAGGGR
jgi:outer membrane protein